MQVFWQEMKIRSINNNNSNNYSFKRTDYYLNYEDDYMTPYHNITMKDILISSFVLSSFLLILSSVFTKIPMPTNKISLFFKKLTNKKTDSFNKII